MEWVHGSICYWPWYEVDGYSADKLFVFFMSQNNDGYTLIELSNILLYVTLIEQSDIGVNRSDGFYL